MPDEVRDEQIGYEDQGQGIMENSTYNTKTRSSKRTKMKEENPVTDVDKVMPLMNLITQAIIEQTFPLSSQPLTDPELINVLH